MNSRVNPADLRRPMKQGIAYSHFNVQAEPPQRRLLAWRDRVGHVIDVLPSRSDLERPFRASIDRYQVGDLVFTDCRSDLMVLDRSLTFNEEDLDFSKAPQHAALPEGTPPQRPSRALGSRIPY